MPPRRLYVLRHGETAENATGIWQGHLDADLTDRGRRQAAAAGEALRVEPITRVVSSDLSRARETAEIVGRAIGHTPEVDARWREFDVGEWTGLANTEVIARNPEERDAVLRGEEQRRGITGEAPSHVAARVRPALASLVASLGEGEAGLIVTHSGTSRVLMWELAGVDVPTCVRSFTGLRNCRWAEYIQVRDAWQVYGWNLRAPDLGGDDVGR